MTHSHCKSWISGSSNSSSNFSVFLRPVWPSSRSSSCGSDSYKKENYHIHPQNFMKSCHLSFFTSISVTVHFDVVSLLFDCRIFTTKNGQLSVEQIKNINETNLRHRPWNLRQSSFQISILIIIFPGLPNSFDSEFDWSIFRLPFDWQEGVHGRPFNKFFLSLIISNDSHFLEFPFV